MNKDKSVIDAFHNHLHKALYIEVLQHLHQVLNSCPSHITVCANFGISVMLNQNINQIY